MQITELYTPRSISFESETVTSLPNLNDKYPIFGSSKFRKSHRHIQDLATKFIQDIIDNNPNDLFCWSDGSVRKHLPHSAGVSSIISTSIDVISEHAVRLDTDSISVAEICGVNLGQRTANLIKA